MSNRDHWQSVYQTKTTNTVSWYQEHATTSLKLIHSASVSKSSAIIDVGGGASKLVDDLLMQGYTNLCVLDISDTALAATRERLSQIPGVSQQHGKVDWIVADITRAELSQNTIDLWHDRAVFHFLTQQDDREAYKKLLRNSLKPDGHLIIATFAEDGPDKCSNLPVMRYSVENLCEEFAQDFVILSSQYEIHETPAGNTQSFVYCHFQKR